MAQVGSTISPIRFAVLCRGPQLRAWQARCLEAILDVPGTELVALILDARGAPSGGGRARLGRLASSRNRLWNAYNNLYVARRSRALQDVDWSDRLATVPTLSVTVERRGKFSEYFPEAALALIAELQLDFALRFAFGIIRGSILEIPRYGVWSFHHGDEERYRGGPPCFWEVNDGTSVTGAVLQRLTDRLDAGVILQKGWFRTTRHSYVRTTDDVHLGSAPWPAKVCRDLRNGVADYLDVPPSSSMAPIYHNPRDRAMLAFLGRLGARSVRIQLQSILWSDQWNIGVIDRPIESLLDDAPLPEPRWFPPSRRSSYVADPFGVPHGGNDGVLAEHYDYRTRRGTIVAFTATGKRIGLPKGLPSEEHTSYPFLVEADGELYCLPECSSIDGIRWFRAVHHPTAWKEVGTLVPGVAALDPTIVHHDGRWWLFFTERSASLTALYLWWADDVLGPWTPHGSNPVKTDVRSARPAGTPFVVDGQLYRPAQDCSDDYGAAVVVNKVQLITPERYHERPVNVLRPGRAWRYQRGLHTVSAFGDQLLVDSKRRVFVPRATLFELRARLHRRSP
jgi:hypothetical protein